jgi:hypothetical protein
MTTTATTPITTQIAQARQTMQDMITLGFSLEMRELQERRINALKAKLAASVTEETATVTSTEDRIIATIRSLAAQPNDLVSLARVRAAIDDVDHAEMTRVLKAMDRARVIQLDPDPNRKALTSAAIEAAIEIGGEPKHLVSLI